MKWNKDQEKAIYTTNKDIVVSASAGAGKTSILVERLLVLCTREKNPIDLDRIVAMTFTEAAAAEMKKRLSKSLNKKLEEPNANIDQINKQLILLDTAQISTIHSFCLNIIKKYYDVINLNPDMIKNTLDDITVENIKSTAFDKVFLNYTKDNDVVSLVNLFSENVYSTDNLKKYVLKIVQAANSVYDTEKWYEKSLNKYKQVKHFNEIDTEITSLYYMSLIEKMIGIKDKINTLISSLIEHSFETQSSIDKLEKLKHHINISINYLKNNNYEDCIFEFNKIESFKASKFNDYEKELKNKIYKNIKSLNITLYSPELIVSINNQLHNHVKQLIDLSKLTSKEIQKLKIIENGIDFDDMEQYAYKILSSNNNMISERLKLEYDEILVDEFQDTNEIQNQIVNLISKGNNTFRVGDIKQSIYRFRKAKPSIMRDLMNNPNYQLISLKNNYRSKENIVTFTNTLFSKLMNIDGFSDKYEDIDTVDIGVESQLDYKKNSIIFYALKKLESDSELNNNQLKASFIANKIKEMVETKTYDYRDFVILTKSHSVKDYLIESFDSLNIPYFIDNKSGFYSSWMSHILISYLKILDDVSDDISLMSVITSPLYDMCDEECANLVINYGSILKGLYHINHKLLDDIKILKEIYNTKSITALLDKISLINNFINEKCDIQQRTNFDLFYEKAINFEKKSLNLKDFINLVSFETEDKSGEAISVGEDDNVVRAMTIHHSKGLQFKVVFYWSTEYSKKETIDTVLTDSDLGIGLDYVDSKYYIKYNSIQKQAIALKIEDEASQEFIRLLYVALTRAQEELYIVDTFTNEFELNNLTKYFVKTNTSGTSLISSTLENNDIFKYEFIYGYNFETETVKTIKPIPTLPYYKDIDIKEIEVVTPSKDGHELSLDIDLNRNDDAVNRGTLMHQYIEILPDRIWNEEDILKITDLNQKDINSLVSFNKSEIFKKSLNMNIYHEYPFIIKEDNSIINGIIDFLAIDEKEVIIIDFKSDRNVTRESLIQMYTPQIMHYVDSLKKIHPNKSIKAYIYSFTLNEEIPLN